MDQAVDPHLLHCDLPLVSHKAKNSVILCFLSIPALFVRSYLHMGLHTIVMLMTLNSSSPFVFKTIMLHDSAWDHSMPGRHHMENSNQLKLNLSKTVLLFLPGDASPC